jgi:hypothetical protein
MFEELHAQPAGAVTVTLPPPPDEAKDEPGEERAYVHGCGLGTLRSVVYDNSLEYVLSPELP